MPSLADRITAQLQVLVGQPLGDCWRAADMIIFEFGPRRRITNVRGEPVEVSEVRLHIQCPWRIVEPSRLWFGRADVQVSADATSQAETFDPGVHDTRLDLLRRAWIRGQRNQPFVVEGVCGDPYGGFRLEFTGGFALETFPTTAAPDQEQWRLCRADGTHFVVNGWDAHLVPPDPST